MNVLLFVFAGGLSSLLYFGGLWWTVQRFAAARHPGLFYFSSLVLRLTILLGVVWLAIQVGQLVAVLAFLAGFVVVRMFAVPHLAGTKTSVSES